MPGWIEYITSGPVILVLGILLSLAWIAFKAWKPVSRLVVFLYELIGDEEKGKAGLLERLKVLEDQQAEQGQRIERIHAEVTPNHGGSLKDAVNRIEKRQTKDVDDLAEHIAYSLRDEERLAEAEEAIEELKELMGGDE